MWWKVKYWCVCSFINRHCLTGLHILAKELNPYNAWRERDESKERFDVALQQMFPTSADKKVDQMRSLTESYHQYKREYVKHININSDNENLSRCFLTLKLFIYFQLQRWSMHHLKLCTFTLTRQPMMRLKGTRRWHFSIFWPCLRLKCKHVHKSSQEAAISNMACIVQLSLSFYLSILMSKSWLSNLSKICVATYWLKIWPPCGTIIQLL